MKTKKKNRPYTLGFQDGLDNPRLLWGRTWSDWKKNEEYDRGVNAGQRAARRKAGSKVRP